jgi:hypothetical protein
MLSPTQDPEGSTVVHVQFEVDSPMVEEFGGLAVPAAGRASAWHNVGDSGAGGGGLFQLLSQLVRVGGVLF